MVKESNANSPLNALPTVEACWWHATQLTPSNAKLSWNNCAIA